MRRLISALLLMFGAIAASAQTKIVWEIGKYNQSSLEFPAAQRDRVLYQVGTSDWKADWPGEQLAGSEYQIHFTLPNAPRGVFILKIGILAYSPLLSSPQIPAMQVEVNGHKGLYYLHPKIDYAVLEPHHLPSDLLVIDIPADYLRTGENSLILSCIDIQPSRFGRNGPSGIHYDALSLVNDTHAEYDRQTLHPIVTPTIFYHQTDGRLRELVEAFLRFGKAAPAGSVALMVNGKRYEAKLIAMSDFGEQRLEFELPEWNGTIRGHLEVTAGTHSAFDISLTAARKWTLFVVPHTHVDIGYTDYQGKVAEMQARTLGEAANLIRENPAFRLTTDGSWNVEQFLATRSPEKQAEFLKLVQEDKIGVPAQYANLLTGYASLETLYRSLYYSKQLSRKYNVPFIYANTTDVPTYSGAYPSVLASAGIKYWVAAGNNGRAPILSHEQWNEKSPFWWEGPDGNKVLFWYSDLYAQVKHLFGLPPQEASAYDALPIFLQAYSKPSYKPDVVLIYGAQSENTTLYPELATFATAWDRNYAYPKLVYATFADFFRVLDDNYGNDLSAYKGDMGPYWEDGVGSDAYYTTEDRENQSQALSAEIVSTVSHNVDPDVHPPKEELTDIWKNILLYAEHTWTAGRSVTEPDSEESVKQLAVKDNRATQARLEITDLANRSIGQLANEIHVPASTLVVFNALNWRRDALVEIDLRQNEELVDLTTGQLVPVEVLFRKQQFAHVRFLATSLSPVGYKCFQIRSAVNSAPAASQPEKDPVIENQYYRITVDATSGAVQSIFDKQLRRELVDSHSLYKFGQYLYVTGGDGQTRIIRAIDALPLAQLTIHPAGNGEYLGTRRTPWGYSIHLRSSDVNTPTINLEILLYNDQKKIEFRYSVQKQYTNAKEGVYFAFPIAVSPPKFAYAIQQGWIDPARNLLKGASLEWFTVHHWMAAEDSHLAVGIVPVDAPLASFGDINRGEWPAEFHPKTSTIFSYAMNNYWFTNYRAGQGGAFTFRYVVTSADRLDPAAMTRLGMESMQAPEMDQVVDQEKIDNPDRPLPAGGTSFLDVDAPNVVLVDWKLAEDGKGTILRLQETAGRMTEMKVGLPYTAIHSAELCNAVEDKLRDLQISGNQIRLTLHPYEIATVRIVGDAVLRPSTP